MDDTYIYNAIGSRCLVVLMHISTLVMHKNAFWILTIHDQIPGSIFINVQFLRTFNNMVVYPMCFLVDVTWLWSLPFGYIGTKDSAFLGVFIEYYWNTSVDSWARPTTLDGTSRIFFKKVWPKFQNIIHIDRFLFKHECRDAACNLIAMYKKQKPSNMKTMHAFLS